MIRESCNVVALRSNCLAGRTVASPLTDRCDDLGAVHISVTEPLIQIRPTLARRPAEFCSEFVDSHLLSWRWIQLTVLLNNDLPLANLRCISISTIRLAPLDCEVAHSNMTSGHMALGGAYANGHLGSTRSEPSCRGGRGRRGRVRRTRVLTGQPECHRTACGGRQGQPVPVLRGQARPLLVHRRCRQSARPRRDGGPHSRTRPR